MKEHRQRPHKMEGTQTSFSPAIDSNVDWTTVHRECFDEIHSCSTGRKIGNLKRRSVSDDSRIRDTQNLKMTEKKQNEMNEMKK